MWNLIPRQKTVPTMVMRFCCKELKESCGKGRITVTGVRWAEGTKRKATRGLVNIGDKKTENITLNMDNDDARRMVEQCYRTKKTLVNPIIDWSDDEVWEYIKTNNLKYNPLYDKGYKRVGCIGCPMNKDRQKDFERYPKIKDLYTMAINKMLATKKYKTWKTADDVWEWWIQKPSGESKWQTNLFDGGEDD